MIFGIQFTELLLFTVVGLHVYLTPGTKVEESFNIQAVHDLIYHSWNVTAYDHHEFPGVVPRTFAGPAFLAVFSYPVRLLFSYFEIPKYCMQSFVRLVLGITVALSLCNFARCLGKHYGNVCATLFRLICVSQFHFLFYASRPLPNTFAMPFVIMVFQRLLESRYQPIEQNNGALTEEAKSAVRWATAAVVLFRCELVLLFAPVFILAWLQKRIIFFDFQGNGAIFVGLATAVQVLISTIPLDTLLWERLIYPEAEVAWFNVVENKSHEYGVMPFLWYFYNALPRCLLSSMAMAPFALYFGDQTSHQFVIPPFIFVFLYSFLPHKELRFILYVVPALNAAAAIFMRTMHLKSAESWFWKLVSYGCRLAILVNVLATAVFTLTAMHNYPAWTALKKLQEIQQANADRPIRLHIDVASAQTGVTRFMQLYEAWEYNKTEDFALEDFNRFDFLLVGTYENNLNEIVNQFPNHTKWFTTKGFSRFEWRIYHDLPFRAPFMGLADRVAVLKKL